MFILVLISALFMLLPVLYAIGAAFKPLDEIYIFPPRLFAHNPTWKNFQEIAALADTFWVPMSRYLFNTILICSVIYAFISFLVFIIETFIDRKFYCLSTSGSPFFPGILEDYTCLAPGS